MRILLGVTGSIAAYKALYLCRLFVKNGHDVSVIMTESATKFVSALSFSSLSKHPVHTHVIENDSWANHVELGLWADVMIIAPTTATSLAKLANGLADNIVVACYLSAKCPVYIAPAMDLDMWKHGSTTSNLNKLISYGDRIVPVGHGELASGLHGDGRMAEPEDIYAMVLSEEAKKEDLKDKQILITAGPTVESIDPVRFISNHSTGLMGIKLAEECILRGAQVHLVLGPTDLKAMPHARLDVLNVKSAQDMFDACQGLFERMDISIFAAAVADYTPVDSSAQKIKKTDAQMSISLKRTIDIAFTLGQQKKSGQLTIGFALETQNEAEHALNKLHKKNFDLIVLNSLNDPGAGFGHATNKVTLYRKDGERLFYELKTKQEVAKDIVDQIIHLPS